MQNVPFQLKEAGLNLKALFIPDSDDYEIYDMDISNAEMRTLTAYSKDKALIDVFNSNKDMHCLTAAGISDYSYDDILANKEDKTTDHYKKRQVAKVVNFGTIYCMASTTLKDNLWKMMRIEVTEEEAASYLNKFFETYPGVTAYIANTKAFAQRYHFTYTYMGRRRRFPIATYNSSMANRVARQAVNARIQSTSADIVGMNMLAVDKLIRPLGGRSILTVHDSMVFQLPKGSTGIKALLDKAIIEDTRSQLPWLPVEWKYDCAFGKSYGEAKNDVA